MFAPDIFPLMAINAAACLHLCGFFVTNQLRLRLLMMGGNAFYAVYYLIATPTPQWPAMAWSLAFIVANACTMIKLREREEKAKTEEKHAKPAAGWI